MTRTRRPNIPMFMPDAMHAQVTRPDHPCRTPYFDELARRGLRFDRAYTCTPDGLSGALPHAHGAVFSPRRIDELRPRVAPDRAAGRPARIREAPVVIAEDRGNHI